MADEGFKRKLSAILSADVVGYSRLMREDEEKTVRTLTTFRKALNQLIQLYRGRVVDSPGDNILAEFTSVVDAVNCAVEIQRELAELNAEFSENRRMQFRIGINLGDVIEEGKRIYGDGVNIAARLESLAEEAGICISGTVYDAVESKIGLEFEFLGEQEVKNIDKPIRAYRILSFPGAAAHRVVRAKRAVGRAWRKVFVAMIAVFIAGAAAIWHFYFRYPSMETASSEKTAFPLANEFSIAVLPFTNMSGDPEQEFLSDGITEEIISGLSKVPNLFVIARNSVFTYKGKSINIEQVGKELGVRYVLEGSFRKAQDRVRITAQLIDTSTGGHVWSERYDRNLTDIFALQDDITQKIMAALQIKLTGGEEARLFAKGTDNLDAYIKFLRGRRLILNYNKEDNALGRQLMEEVIATDPNYASAYFALSGTYFIDILVGTSKSPQESMMMAIKHCKQAIALDETMSSAQAWLGFLYSRIGKYDEGIALCKRGVELGPTDEGAYRYLAMALRVAGRWEEAITASEKAIRLNPFPESGTLSGLGMAYGFTGQFEKAIMACQKATKKNPQDLISHVSLAAVYGMADMIAEAKAASADVLRIEPNFSAEKFVKRLKWKREEDKDNFLKALQKTGL
jgi:adenylate cyclase